MKLCRILNGIILSVIGVTIRGQEHLSVDYCEPCGRAFVDNTDIRSSFENIAEKLFHLVVETRNEICKLYRTRIHDSDMARNYNNQPVSYTYNSSRYKSKLVQSYDTLTNIAIYRKITDFSLDEYQVRFSKQQMRWLLCSLQVVARQYGKLIPRSVCQKSIVLETWPRSIAEYNQWSYSVLRNNMYQFCLVRNSLSRVVPGMTSSRCMRTSFNVDNC